MPSFATSAFVGAVALLAMYFCVHQVEEGHVGVYMRGGALLEHTSEPGLHFKLPLITTVENVQVTMQTDSVQNIPCGTSGGTVVYFEKIEVVNRLNKSNVYNTVKNYGINYDKMWIFDKIHHEINQFCSRHSLREVYIDRFDILDDSLAKALQSACDKYDTGIQIIAVRVTKPTIPDAIRKNYEAVEAQRTRAIITEQTQKVIQKEAETTRLVATIEAEKESEVSRVEMEQLIFEKESNQKISAIEDEIHMAKVRAQSDAENYKFNREAEANKFKLTSQYLKQQLLKKIANNPKLFFGEQIPDMLFDLDALFKDQNIFSHEAANDKE